MDQLDKIVIGKIIGTHGLRGNVKVFSMADNPEDIFKYDLFTLDAENNLKALELKMAFRKQNVFVCSVSEINSIEEAQGLIGAKIYTPKHSLPDLDSEAFYAFELEGAEVYCEGKKIGTVVGMNNYPGMSNVALEIQISDHNVLHLAEFTKSNFPDQTNVETTSGDRFSNPIKRLDINPEIVAYLKHL